MKTIIDIINYENKLYQEKVELEYNKRKNEYEKSLESLRRTISDKKALKGSYEINIQSLQEKYSELTKRINNQPVKGLLKVILFISVTLFIMFVLFLLFLSWGGPRDGCIVWSILLGLFIGPGIYVGLIDKIIDKKMPDPSDITRESSEDLINQIKKYEKLNKEILTTINNYENELISLNSNPILKENISKEYNTKVFFEEIKNNVLQGNTIKTAVINSSQSGYTGYGIRNI